ncbi:Thiamine kinase [Variovorax sp. YR750]|uniref:choline kinase family protein n=1 Tax=Variovorax sp. YR750 TaxID=1884384 RepID=UPI0008BCDEDD|nr:choline kinase family protein [Variovorax sp. YR750]SEM04743.1 Thiamine kinase [Variovorax sp. YR750]
MWQLLGQGTSEDERRVEKIISKWPDWTGLDMSYCPVSGGISNTNWRVHVAGTPRDFFVKIPGRGTDRFIERNAAHEASVKAHACGYGVPVVGFMKDEGVEIFEFVDGWRTSTNLDFLDKEIRHNAVGALRAFNDSGPLELTKTVFDMIDEHVAQVAELNSWKPRDLTWMLEQRDEARAALEASGLDLVPCMNDTLAGNFMIGPGKEIVILDLEYASNNERAYELALWFGEMFFEDSVEREMIEAYYGRWTGALDARVRVLRALADLKWATWAMVQESLSTLDFDFRKYGLWKYNRARLVLHHPDWPNWLKLL